MSNLQKNAKGTSAIIASLILTMILGFGITALTIYSNIESSKVAASITQVSVERKSELIKDAIIPYATENDTVIIPGIYYNEISYVIEKDTSTGKITVYRKTSPPPYVFKTNGNLLAIDLTNLGTLENKDIIVLLKEGGSFSINELVSRALNTTSPLSSSVNELITSLKNESTLDTFVKSLLTPAELYRIYLQDNVNSVPTTTELRIEIPLKITASQNIINRYFELTRNSCPFGKLRPVYVLTESNATLLIKNGNEVIYNKTVILSAKAFTRSSSVKDTYAAKARFDGLIKDEKGMPLFKYKGSITFVHVLSQSGPYPSGCTNYYTASPPYTRFNVRIEITLEKIDESKGALIIITKDPDFIYGANTRPSIESKSISPSSQRDSFILIYSPPGKREITVFSEYTVFSKTWGIKMNQDGIFIDAIVQLFD